MNSTVLAPRPTRSNWGKVIYNILHENNNHPLTKENIWALVPSSMHVPHSRARFTASLTSMVNHRFLEARGPRGTRMVRIATAEAHAARLGVMNEYRLSALAKKKASKKKAAKPRRKYTRKGSVDTPTTRMPNALEAQLDTAITDVSDQIAVLQARGVKLIAMRKLAGDL